MREDTKTYLLTLLAFVVGALLAFLVFAGPAQATTQPDNCPVGEGQFKFDYDEGQWEPSDPGIDLVFGLDDEDEPKSVSAPEGWTVVCYKQPLVGRDNDRLGGISHVVVEREIPEDTNGGDEGDENGDENEEEPSDPEDTTTTTEHRSARGGTESDPAPDAEAGAEPPSDSTTTSVTSPTTTSAPSTPDSESELPFTGAGGLLGLTALATALMGGGLALLRRGRV
jgi:hypothetical protein